MKHVPPASGAIVMGTGIISVGLASDNQHALSLVLLAIAGVAWLVLGVVLADGIVRDRARIRQEAHSPAALTAVAGTAVLGARVSTLGWSGLAAASLVIAASAWLVLLWPVLRGLSRKVAGVAFMVTVSTQSLSVLAAELAAREHAAWLLYAALALFALGLAAYALVLTAFDFRQLLEGRGDHWVAGGALAICALAAARLAIGAHRLHVLGSGSSFKPASLALWGLSIAWLVVLVIGEAIRPRVRYDLRRWATVFPVGMYAACSFDAGSAAGVPALRDFARGWVWVGLAMWCVLFAATVWHRRAGHSSDSLEEPSGQ